VIICDLRCQLDVRVTLGKITGDMMDFVVVEWPSAVARRWASSALSRACNRWNAYRSPSSPLTGRHLANEPTTSSTRQSETLNNGCWVIMALVWPYLPAVLATAPSQATSITPGGRHRCNHYPGLSRLFHWPPVIGTRWPYRPFRRPGIARRGSDRRDTAGHRSPPCTADGGCHDGHGRTPTNAYTVADIRTLARPYAPGEHRIHTDGLPIRRAEQSHSGCSQISRKR
jgi:hypothetical protein